MNRPTSSRRHATRAARLRRALDGETVDLAGAALVAAELECPALEPGRSIAVLDGLGERARDRLRPVARESLRIRIDALNRFLYQEVGFAGNAADYDDFRNSLLNVVLDRRLGIPITLALVYREVAGRAGIDVHGIPFPGHFLLAVPTDGAAGTPLILDPFNGGAELTEAGCRALLTRHLGDDEAYDATLLRPCTARLWMTRLLNNLKRAYVELRSFRQAWQVADLVLAADASLVSERRDRGLLAYHLGDFPSALSDLEDYLRLTAPGDDAAGDEREKIWEHVRALRRRVASRN